MLGIYYKSHIQNDRILIIIEDKCWVSRSLLYYSIFCMPKVFHKTCFLRLVTQENAHNIILNGIWWGEQNINRISYMILNLLKAHIDTEKIAWKDIL